MPDGTVQVVRELASDVCRCRRRKMSRKSFCLDCYHRLPPELQQGLYKPLAGGYVAAYLKAWAWLEALEA